MVVILKFIQCAILSTLYNRILIICKQRKLFLVAPTAASPTAVAADNSGRSVGTGGSSCVAAGGDDVGQHPVVPASLEPGRDEETALSGSQGQLCVHQSIQSVHACMHERMGIKRWWVG